MFSGIIRYRGRVVHLERGPEGGRLTLEVGSELAASLALGDSLAVNGCCLTLAELGGGKLTFDLTPETLAKTNLGELASGSLVNLEPSLRLGEPVHGHLVYGHVDGVGVVEEISATDGGGRLTVALPEELSRYLFPTLSLAVDGISLTVQGVEGNRASFALVPTTLGETNLAERKVGDRVNIEVDMVVKAAFAAARAALGQESSGGTEVG